MEGAATGHHDQETDNLTIEQEACALSDNAEMVDQNDFPDELNLEIKTVESIQESKVCN